MAEDFSPVDRVLEGLRGAGYLADRTTGTVVHLATALGKPVLVEGPAGTGKTQLAKSAALAAGKPLIRLQCYEGLDESKAIYEWDYRRQALLLQVLSDYQVSIPEFGTVTARHIPQVFLTSNNSRDLSEALKRRCLFLHLGYPSTEREAEIVRLHVPELAEHHAAEIAELVALLRQADLKKPPSIAESLDWARTLLTLGATELSDDLIRQTLSVLLKYERDIDTAVTELRI